MLAQGGKELPEEIPRSDASSSRLLFYLSFRILFLTLLHTKKEKKKKKKIYLSSELVHLKMFFFLFFFLSSQWPGTASQAFLSLFLSFSLPRCYNIHQRQQSFFLSFFQARYPNTTRLHDFLFTGKEKYHFSHTHSHTMWACTKNLFFIRSDLFTCLLLLFLVQEFCVWAAGSSRLEQLTKGEDPGEMPMILPQMKWDEKSFV